MLPCYSLSRLFEVLLDSLGFSFSPPFCLWATLSSLAKVILTVNYFFHGHNRFLITISNFFPMTLEYDFLWNAAVPVSQELCGESCNECKYFFLVFLSFYCSWDLFANPLHVTSSFYYCSKLTSFSYCICECKYGFQFLFLSLLELGYACLR